MATLQVFDPAMCCSTGVCGPQVDPALPQFASDLEFLGTQGIQVTRFNLAQEVMALSGKDLDPAGRALLEEDLRSPCTTEIAVFRAFAKEVARGVEGFVVIDTAPTGHTLLLLDAAEAYHREVSRTAQELPEEVRTLLPRLRDPAFTKVFLVSLPEATPVHEAKGLEQDLRRAGILPFAWVLNQSLRPLSLTDPVLQARAKAEGPYLQEVASFGLPWTLLPWMEDPLGYLVKANTEAIPSSTH